MAYLTPEQKQHWEDHGYIHLTDFFTDQEKKELVEWVADLEARPETAGKWMKYFEKPADGSEGRLLCRVENFLQYHEGFDNLLRGERIYGILEELMGEPAVLFKEKINFKLPGANGFGAHQDAPAFTTFGQKYHITMMISIDASSVENGCLEVVEGGWHKKGMLPQDAGMALDPEFSATLDWKPVETQIGDVLFFDSYIPHGSGPNTSSRSRKALYITYNKASEGSYRDQYYADKREVFPPDVERDPNKVYGNSGVYNVANPVNPGM